LGTQLRFLDPQALMCQSSNSSSTKNVIKLTLTGAQTLLTSRCPFSPQIARSCRALRWALTLTFLSLECLSSVLGLGSVGPLTCIQIGCPTS
ncbi:unnamed protein product, partial [Dovyalis caffra]